MRGLSSLIESRIFRLKRMKDIYSVYDILRTQRSICVDTFRLSGGVLATTRLFTIKLFYNTKSYNIVVLKLDYFLEFF